MPRLALWLAVAAVLAACDSNPDSTSTLPSPAPASFVGNAVCAECHAAEVERWTGSHHDLAMQVATPDSVLGAFDNRSFVYANVTTTFFRRDGEYWVNTDGAGGELEDFRITHAFGIDPLQQYLIEMPGGRYQALSIAWDARPSEQGGQRWFHLYPDERITSGDPLHWTGVYQSWNTMCASCHSTRLSKAYDPEADRFATSWSSIDVACEACHGPGSNHAAEPAVAPPALATVARAWVFGDGERIATRAGESPARAELEVCAQCHARRAQLSDAVEASRPFLDAFRPALLDADLYHADGQISDEVYVYGSFQQSAMAAAGVTCSDCHDPHSTQLRAAGNGLCANCHVAEVYDSPAHHRHAEGGAGSECVSCHMRAETYMVIDPRRDHSFRVPRPDLSLRVGSPNACNDCHADRSAEWAAEQTAQWYPQGRHTQFHYGEALHAGRSWAAESKALLRGLIENRDMPAIVRATAVSLIVAQLDDAVLALLGDALNENEPLLQLAAIEAMQDAPAELRVDYLQRFLTHDLKSLRIAAARVLVTARAGLSQRRQRDFDAALAEYLDAQQLNGDRGEGSFNEAVVLAELGRFPEAERAYLRAIQHDPAFTASYVNLSDLYRSLGREQDAQSTLEDGLALAPGDAGIRFALGLALVRSGDLDAAMTHIASAVREAPGSPYYAYAYAIAMNSAGDSSRALELLRATHERFPAHRDTLIGLATILRDAGQTSEALEYTRKLVALSASDATARSLLLELESAQ